ncbi:MAG: OmpH family outer membrane protein [Candidatus Micrarchaeaceae archaeon]
MRGYLVAGVTLSALIVSTPALAGGIAYVDYEQLLQKAPQVKASNASLEQEFAPRMKAIGKQQDALKSLRQQLSDFWPGGNPLQRASLIEKFRHARSALKKTEQAYRSALDLRRAQLQNSFKQVLGDDIEAYAKAHGIDLVIKSGGIYAGQAVDVTADILNRLKQDYRKAQAQEKSK